MASPPEKPGNEAVGLCEGGADVPEVVVEQPGHDPFPVLGGGPNVVDGRDVPPNGLKKIAGSFSEDEKDAMFRGTATRVYRL